MVAGKVCNKGAAYCLSGRNGCSGGPCKIEVTDQLFAPPPLCLNLAHKVGMPGIFLAPELTDVPQTQHVNLGIGVVIQAQQLHGRAVQKGSTQPPRPPPQTPNPKTKTKPKTQNSKPKTQNPKPKTHTQNPKPKTQDPKVNALNPRPQTLNPNP